MNGASKVIKRYGGKQKLYGDGHGALSESLT